MWFMIKCVFEKLPFFVGHIQTNIEPLALKVSCKNGIVEKLEDWTLKV